MNRLNTIVFILLLLTFLLLNSCQQKKGNTSLRFPSYIDSTYLVIEGNLLEPETVWKNIKVFVRAGERLEQHLFVENGMFKWDINKGADIKISENIFQHFLHMWEESNKNLKTGNYEIRNIQGRKFAVPKNSRHTKNNTCATINN